MEIKDIQKAHERIRPFIHKTPLIYSNSFSALTGAEVYMKAENLQKTGSFKVRGAFNKLIGLENKRVLAASMGNHAQGVAFASGRLGLKARIVMPVTAPIVKQEATKGYGADVVLYGEGFQDAMNYALMQKDHAFIHAFDDEKIIAGQGTVGMEIAEDIKDIDYVLVPVGGGGLIAGLAVALKTLSPETRILGVQTEAATSAYKSFKTKKLTGIKPSSTLADGISVERVGDITFELIRKYVDDMLLVDEDSIAMAILLFLERKKLVVEGAGAAPLAAVIRNREEFTNKRVVIVVSGGNIDFTLIDRIIHKGLVTSGRIGVFEVIVDDIPGRLHDLTGVIAARKGNILNIVHDRFAPGLAVGQTRVIFTVEIRNKDHLEEIIAELRSRGVAARPSQGL